MRVFASFKFQNLLICIHSYIPSFISLGGATSIAGKGYFEDMGALGGVVGIILRLALSERPGVWCMCSLDIVNGTARQKFSMLCLMPTSTPQPRCRRRQSLVASRLQT